MFRSFVKYTGIIALTVLGFNGCFSSSYTEERFQDLNASIRDRVMIATTDIYPQFLEDQNKISTVPLFKKGERLMIWVEYSDEWMRVKGFAAAKSREQAEGKTIIYLFDKDYVDQKDPVTHLIAQISKIMQPADGLPLQSSGLEGR